MDPIEQLKNNLHTSNEAKRHLMANWECRVLRAEGWGGQGPCLLLYPRAWRGHEYHSGGAYRPDPYAL